MDNKSQALGSALTQIERQFGKGSIMRMGDAPISDVAAISTGAIGLDLALGVGGLPRGRIVEVFGPESSGKTTLIYHVIAEAQRAGGMAAFIDAEHAMDPAYAARIGVNTDELLVSQPDHGEQALEIADLLVRSGALDVVAIDSVAALVPKAEIEGEIGDSHVGLQARLMSQALRKLAGTLNRAGTTCVFTNQLREKIGVMFGCFHGDSPVVLADGSRMAIGEIVEGRHEVEVLSYDPASGRVEPRPVVSWFDNGVADEFLRIRVSGGPGGSREMVCTPNHTIFTPYGEMSAGDLRPGSEVLAAALHAGVAQRAAVGSSGGGAALAEPPARVGRAYVLGVERLTNLPSMRKYDLEIEGNHTYLVDDVVVHNSPEVTPGGRALKFYASVRLDIRRIETLKEGTEAFGNRVRVKVVKNKVAPPFRQAEFDIIYGEGISHEGGLIDLGLEKGIITKSGSYFSCGDVRLGQGRNAARTFLRDNVDMAADIEARLRETMVVADPSAALPDGLVVDEDGVVTEVEEAVAAK